MRRATRRTSQMSVLKRPQVKASAILPQSSKAGSQNGSNDDVPHNDHHQQIDQLTSQLLETRIRSVFVRVSSCDFVDHSSMGRNRRSTESHELTRTKHPWHTRVWTQSLPLGNSESPCDDHTLIDRDFVNRLAKSRSQLLSSDDCSWSFLGI